MRRHRVTVGSRISVISPFLILLEVGLIAFGSVSALALVERLLFLVCFFAGSAVPCAASDDDCKSIVLVASIARVVDLVFLRLLSLFFSWSFSCGTSWRVVVSRAVSETSLLPLLLILLLQLLLLELVMTWQRGSGTSALNPILLSHDLSWNWKLECLLRGLSLPELSSPFSISCTWRFTEDSEWGALGIGMRFSVISVREKKTVSAVNHMASLKCSVLNVIGSLMHALVHTYCWSIDVGAPVVVAELLQVAVT